MRAMEPHDHAILVYADPAKLLAALGRFAQAGEANGELVVFVHAFDTQDEAVAWVRSSGEPLAHMLDRSLILVSFYQDAFEAGRGRIDFDHVVGVVEGLLRTATAEGRRGLRVFVDASRVYLEGGRANEWFAFEERLGRRLHHAMALLCAYPARIVETPQVLERVMLTHLYRLEA